MITNANGTRYSKYKKLNSTLHQPYDYENEGLLRRVMSHKLWNSKNPILQYILGFVERSMVFCMKVASDLENFYNYNHYNR